MTLPLLLMSGTLGALASAVHPAYLLEWAQETDRFYTGANGPVCWLLSRADGGTVSEPDEGSVTLLQNGVEIATYSLDADGDTSGYTIAALIDFETSGSFRLRIALLMPDGTTVITETPVYIIS